MTTVCQICGKVLEFNEQALKALWEPLVKNPKSEAAIYAAAEKWMPMVGHADCIARREQDGRSNAAHDKRKRLVARWNRACPAAFLETQFDKIPFDPKKEVLEAIAEGQSVILVGPTGRGKTRLIWEACRPVFMSGKTVSIYTHIGLSKELLTLTGKGPHWVPAALYQMKERDLVFIDDFGQAKMVADDGKGMQNEEFITELIDYRTSHKKQTLMTANYVGPQLEAKMSDRGKPLVRRLREFFKQFTG